MEAQKKEGKTPSVETQKIYDEADKYRSSEDNAQLLDFINKPLNMKEFVNDEDIKRHVFTVIINSVEKSEFEEGGKPTPLYNMLKAIPETELRDVSGGENNNNNSKSKKNKKSNKNKTKKRKGKSSSSRKFKFAKVKKM